MAKKALEFQRFIEGDMPLSEFRLASITHTRLICTYVSPGQQTVKVVYKFDHGRAQVVREVKAHDGWCDYETVSMRQSDLEFFYNRNDLLYSAADYAVWAIFRMLSEQYGMKHALGYEAEISHKKAVKIFGEDWDLWQWSPHEVMTMSAQT